MKQHCTDAQYSNLNNAAVDVKEGRNVKVDGVALYNLLVDHEALWKKVVAMGDLPEPAGDGRKAKPVVPLPEGAAGEVPWDEDGPPGETARQKRRRLRAERKAAAVSEDAATPKKRRRK